MATEKQIHANRKNAQNSTGPKTPQGKATAAKNATKHGLTAQNILIKGENLEDFQEHRDKLTHELNPIFQTEVIITDRIVNLSWQLKRCAHLQAAALDYIINNERFADSENALGKAVFAGFAQTRALDRLIMYERRIENSLYKSMKQLDNLKQITAKQKAESEKDLRRARAEEASRLIPWQDLLVNTAMGVTRFRLLLWEDDLPRRRRSSFCHIPPFALRPFDRYPGAVRRLECHLPGLALRRGVFTFWRCCRGKTDRQPDGVHHQGSIPSPQSVIHWFSPHSALTASGSALHR